ncbi:LuxR C-terminal-related transcriptional regulator [Kribbella sp. CA-247076]|uniref:helix-turn-helix transcriptional regulator n=1 Tax=Kribbella sp. CA-247076 TaxID=3239941 RepID=UPI003D89FC2C
MGGDFARKTAQSGAAARATARAGPPAVRVWVERTALMRLLDDALARPVTLVVAPAGTGKTLTLARWTSERAELPVTWLTSGKDLDPHRFANQLRVAAGVRPLAGRPPPAALISRSADDLIGKEAQQIVVVDDAHLMAARCFALVDELLNTCPSAIRLVLLCRWDPPMDRLIPSLQGDLSVIRGRAFQMSAQESADLVLAHAEDLPPEVVAAIVRRAGGWAAVIALAARTVAGFPDPMRVEEYLTERGWGLADQLAGQVFSTLAARTRHLLLCVAFEETVDPETAVWLSGDPGAGELLAELEASGLLVSREDRGRAGEPVRYRIHPLLSEVLRRQAHAGGVDVTRARAVLRRAARWDATHGDLDQGFRRLVAVEAWDDAVRLIADHGVELLMLGHGPLIRTVARAAPETVDAVPRTWAILAIERLLHADQAGARHWTDRLDGEESLARSADVASLRLVQAWSDRRTLAAEVDQATRLVNASGDATATSAPHAWLLAELGSAENWLGRLAQAHGHLRQAAAIARSLGLTRLVASALSHLAMTEYMVGRDQNCLVLANRALQLAPAAAQDGTYTRARIAQELARPSSTDLSDLVEAPGPLDPTTAVWKLILSARLRLSSGAVDDAAALLDLPPELPPVPPHLAAVLIGERCLRALMHNDREVLATLVTEFGQVGAAAEAALARAFHADIGGDRQAATAALAPVLDGELRQLLPTTRIVATIYQAQLQDSLGYRTAADGLVLEAVRGTADQRIAWPFLGWSMNGTPTHDLLHRIADHSPTPWLLELCAFVDERAGFAAVMRRVRQSPPPNYDPERAGAGLAHVPGLTHREHDVLLQLASGGSYADIADALFISENTVKTHVSSLYAKLGATRRSRALKIARTLHLI